MIGVVLFLSGCLLSGNVTNLEAGFLEGGVNIGPICPVEREGVACEAGPEVYNARKIMVYLGDGKTLVKEINLDGKGNYRAELLEGEYVVDINRIGIDSSGDVPKKIRIDPGKTVVFTINIDTGIR